MINKVFILLGCIAMFAFSVVDVWVNLGHVVVHIGPLVVGFFFAAALRKPMAAESSSAEQATQETRH